MRASTTCTAFTFESMVGIAENILRDQKDILCKAGFVVENHDDASTSASPPSRSASPSPKIQFPYKLPTTVSIVARTGDGKTSILYHMLTTCLITPQEFVELHHGEPMPGHLLEAFLHVRELNKGPQHSALIEPLFINITKAYFAVTTPEEQDRRDSVLAEIENAHLYKIDRTDMASDFQHQSIFGPMGGSGSHGTGIATHFSGSSEPHVLVVFLSRVDLGEELRQYLSTERGLQSTPKLVLTDQLKGEHQYRESLWQLLTGDSTLRTVRSEMVRSEACSQNDSAYVAPMKPWILNLLDRSLIFRTHTLDDNPDLVSSLMFVSAVLHLFVTHTDVADGSGDSEDMAETAEEREAGRKQPLAMQHAAALVLQLAQQDPDGPWGLNIPVTVMMNVFPAIIKCINVFAPVRLLMAFNITIVDGTGHGDTNVLRAAKQRKTESCLGSLIVMTNSKDLSTAGEVMENLKNSPFLARCISSWLDPMATTHPRFCIMISLEKDGLNPQVFSPKKPRNGGSPGTIDVVNYLSKADLRDFINAQEKIMQKKSRPQLANAFKAVLQRPESAHLLQGCAQDDLDRLVRFLVSKVDIFVCLPMLGTTVSSILARLEQCPEQRDDATSKLLSGLCEKLGRRNLTATVPESTSRVSEEELESILHHVRDATRIDHFLAACLLPGYREMIEDVRDKISIMDQLKSKYVDTLVQPAMLSPEVAIKIRERTPALHTKVNSKLFDSHLGSGCTYTTTFQKNKTEARSKLKSIFKDSGITADICKAGADLVKERVEEIASQLSSAQLCDALKPNKNWLEPVLPLSRIIEDSMRQAVKFEHLVTNLMSLRDHLMHSNLLGVASLIESWFVPHVSLALAVHLLERPDWGFLASMMSAYKTSFMPRFKNPKNSEQQYHRLIKAALGRVIKLQRKRLFKKVEAAAVLQMDPHLHLAACLEDVTVKLAEAAEELFLDTLSDQLQLFMSQLGDMEPSKLNSTDCTPRSHNLNPDTFKEFAGKLLDGMKHNVAAKHSNGQLVVAGQKLEQLLNPDKMLARASSSELRQLLGGVFYGRDQQSSGTYATIAMLHAQEQISFGIALKPAQVQGPQAVGDATSTVTTHALMAAFYTAKQKGLRGYELRGSDSGFESFLYQQEGTSLDMLDSREGGRAITSLRKQLHSYEKKGLDIEQSFPEPQRRLENLFVDEMKLPAAAPASNTYSTDRAAAAAAAAAEPSTSLASGQASPSQPAAASCTTLQIVSSPSRRALIDRHLFGLVNGAAMSLGDLLALHELKNVRAIVHSPNYNPAKGYMQELSPAVEGDDRRVVHVARVWGAWVAEQEVTRRRPGGTVGATHGLVASGFLDTWMVFVDPNDA